MPSAIAIITYNAPQFLERQLINIAKYMRPAGIHVFDNSTHAAADIERICMDWPFVNYTRLHNEEGDYSANHAMALNYAYEYLRPKYDVVGFLDHDCIPYKASDWAELTAQNTFVAVAQAGNYPHPGYCFINTKRAKFLNWMPCEGKDTGGRIELHDTHIMPFHYTNEGFEDVGGFLLHCIKGSNWNGGNAEAHSQRVAQYFHKLTEYECAYL